MLFSSRSLDSVFMGLISNVTLRFFKEHPTLFTINMLLSILYVVDDVLIPFLTGKIVTFAQSGKSFKNELITIIVVLFMMQVVYVCTAWHDAIFFPKLENFVRHDMLVKIFEGLSEKFRELRLGQVMSRIVKIPPTLSALLELLKNFAFYFISFVITAFMIMRKDPTLGIVTLAIVLVVFIIILKSPKLCLERTQNQEKDSSNLDEQIEDMLRNLTTVYTSNNTSYELNRLKRYEDHFASSVLSTTTCIVRTRIIALILLGCMLAYFGHRCFTRIKAKKMQTGDFIEMFVIIVQWFGTLGWLSGNIREIVVNWGILMSYQKILTDNDNSIVDATYQHSTPNTQDIIVFKDVSYAVKGRNNPILNNVSFSIEQYERVAICGDIGSGKSTIVKMLVGLIKPTKGDVFINNMSIEDLPFEEIRKNIGYVAQNPQLFNRSILENITYGLSRTSEKKVEQLVHMLGLADAFDNLDKGIHSLAGKNGSNLSGGQRQIIACMRMLLMNPRIIVLDEVTSSIDKQTKKKLFTLFKTLFENKTIIIISHDDDMLSLATRRINIDKGMVLPEDELGKLFRKTI